MSIVSRGPEMEGGQTVGPQDRGETVAKITDLTFSDHNPQNRKGKVFFVIKLRMFSIGMIFSLYS